ncbi:MAG: hypothetical protein ACRD7E_00470 [Bryobacteraceae bacterium]
MRPVRLATGKSDSTSRLLYAPRVSVNGASVDILYAGMTGAGPYQFNVRIPENTPNGNLLVVVDVAGMSNEAQSIKIPVRNRTRALNRVV